MSTTAELLALISVWLGLKFIKSITGNFKKKESERRKFTLVETSANQSILDYLHVTATKQYALFSVNWFIRVRILSQRDRFFSI